MFYLILILLGAIQGATEFLPVSSSGHLALSRILIGQNEAVEMLIEQPLMLDILLHVATLVAVVLYFRRKILDALLGAFRLLKSITGGKAAFASQLETDDGANMALCVIAGTLPTGILGILIEDIAGTVSSTPTYLGLTFLFCAVLLFISRFWKGGEKRLSVKLALIIGIVQGIAVLPGISRSGTTIAVALALGMKREEAAAFSFLLSLPAILGAALLEIDIDAMLVNGPVGAYLVGALSAFAVGLLALYSLVALVKKGRLWLFAPYLTLVSLYLLVFA